VRFHQWIAYYAAEVFGCKPSNQRGRLELEKTGARVYKFFVVIESIREFNRAVPFKPYEIRMASGERYSVKHPDFVFVAPRGSMVIVFGKGDHPHHLSSILIESASPLNGHHRRRNKKA
jgi:hypothetical protein